MEEGRSNTIPKLKLVLRQGSVVQEPATVQPTYPFPIIHTEPPTRSSLLPNHQFASTIKDAPLGSWIDLNQLTRSAAVAAYQNLETILDILPKLNGVEKKRQLISFCLKYRESFHKLFILWSWIGRVEELKLATGVNVYLDKYVRCLSETADSLFNASSILLHYRTPQVALDATLGLLSGTLVHQFPIHFQTMLLDDPDKPKSCNEQYWKGALDQILRLELLNPVIPASVCSITRLEGNGTVLVTFHDLITVSITVVPDFDNRAYCWFILRIASVANESNHVKIDLGALLFILQRSFNYKSTKESLFFHDLAFSIEVYLKLCHFYSIKQVIDALVISKRIDLGIAFKAENEMLVRLWSRSLESVSPWISIQFTMDRPRRKVKLSIKSWNDACQAVDSLKLNIDLQHLIWTLILQLHKAYSKSIVYPLYEQMFELASRSWPFFNQHSLTYDNDEHFISIALPLCEINISISLHTGNLAMAYSSPFSTVESTKHLLKTGNPINAFGYLNELHAQQLIVKFNQIWMQAGQSFAKMLVPIDQFHIIGFLHHHHNHHNYLVYLAFRPLQNSYLLVDLVTTTIYLVVGRFQVTSGRYQLNVFRKKTLHNENLGNTSHLQNISILFADLAESIKNQSLELVDFFFQAELQQLGICFFKPAKRVLELLNFGISVNVQRVHLELINTHTFIVPTCLIWLSQEAAAFAIKLSGAGIEFSQESSGLRITCEQKAVRASLEIFINRIRGILAILELAINFSTVASLETSIQGLTLTIKSKNQQASRNQPTTTENQPQPQRHQQGHRQGQEQPRQQAVEFSVASEESPKLLPLLLNLPPNSPSYLRSYYQRSLNILPIVQLLE